MKVDHLEITPPNTQTGWQNFRYFLQQVIAAEQTAHLSDHPVTQQVIAQLRQEGIE